MIDKKLLEILVCPESHTPLRPAGDELLARLNAAIAEGKLTNRAGHPVAEPLAEALVREDGQLVYPIVEGIPVLLVDEAISLAELPE